MHDTRAPQDDHSGDQFSGATAEITCRQFVELVTDYFEGALDARTLNQVEEHLVMCDWCVTYVEHLRVTVAALGELADSPPEPSEAILAAVRARSDA